MPLSVVCPGCKKRFSVSEKFAGQKGPCPKCKKEITIPTLEDQVVVHGPETETLKDSKGRSVSKPILREETKFSPKIAIGIGVAVIAVLVIALILRRGPDSDPISGAIPFLGAILLAPPLVLAGYLVLRDDELESYAGKELLIRVAACSASYAFLWGAYWYVSYNFGGLSFMQLAYILPPLILAGGFVAFASLDLDYMMGLLHYGFYLLVTGGLALFIGVEMFVAAS